MELPVIDGRSEKEIYEELLKLAKSYVPEWNIESNSGDAGILLSKIFAGMFFETKKRLNKVPYKNLLYYLNLLGGDVLPVETSKGYVTIQLNEGVDGGVPIRRGTRLYGQTKENERILFETQNDIYAIDNWIKDIYCHSPQQHRLVHSFQENLQQSFTLFDFFSSENLQSHKLYFCEKDLLLVGGGASLYLTVHHEKQPYLENETARFLADNKNAAWFFLTEEGIRRFEHVIALDGTLEICVEEDIPEITLFDHSSRWMMCQLKDESASMELGFTDISISVKAEDIEPDGLYQNDIALTKECFFPFGERFSIYDDFYINCMQVFGKKGATITICMDMISIESVAMEGSYRLPVKWKAFLREEDLKEPEYTEIYVEKVIWEYWNGRGWARLFPDNRYETIFKVNQESTVTMKFLCPIDMELAFVGADFGYWIRARIVSVNQLLYYDGVYQAPFINAIKLGYLYENAQYPFEKIMEEKNMELCDVSTKKTPISVVGLEKGKNPSAYFRLKNPLRGGPIRIYFSNMGKKKLFLPSLKWQYWGVSNGIHRWIDLKVADETEFFAKSGILSFIGQDNFENTVLFGQDGYWIRAVNADGKYDSFQKQDKENLPQFKGAYFNTVRVIQQETMQTMYFYTNEIEVNKICDLNAFPILEAEVWVNEVGSILTSDRYLINEIDTDNVQMETDGQGQIIEYWKRWQCKESLLTAGPKDKVYLLDKKQGIITFGDGIHGEIPPILDTESIRVHYKISAGEKGNLPAYQVKGFVDAVAFVALVTNYEAIGGGCDNETIGAAVERCKRIVQHQNRAVSKDDFSVIAKQADRNIADVKTITSQEEAGISGCVKIAVLPRAYTDVEEDYFTEIKNNILREMKRKAPAVLVFGTGIDIMEVEYIEYCIHIKLIVKSYDDYHEAYTEIEEKLKQFLNPITGNFDGKGFAIGVLPSRLKIYNYLRKSNLIADIENIYIFCYQRVRDYRLELDYDSIFQHAFAVPVNGVHEIEIGIKDTDKQI